MYYWKFKYLSHTLSRDNEIPGRTGFHQDLKMVPILNSVHFPKSFFKSYKNRRFQNGSSYALSSDYPRNSKIHAIKSYFNHLYYLIDDLLDFSTPANCVIFYSGENRDAAEKVAKTLDMFTLELTTGGHYLEDQDLFNLNSTYKNSPLPSTKIGLLWDLASTKFTLGISGRVFSFTVEINPVNEFQTFRTFFRVELPILINQNKDVDELCSWTMIGQQIRSFLMKSISMSNFHFWINVLIFYSSKFLR